VDAAGIDLHRSRQRLVDHQAQHTIVRQQLGQRLHLVGARVEEHKVVDTAALGRDVLQLLLAGGVDDLDAVGGRRAQQAVDAGRRIERDDDRWRRAFLQPARAEAVAAALTADDGHHAAVLDRPARLDAEGAHHAGPRLRQRRFGVADVVGDGDQVAAIVAIEDRRADADELLQTTVQYVAEGHRLTLVVDLGLHHEAVADRVVIAPVLADLHDGQRDLVAEDHRVVGEIAAGDTRVLRSQPDHLDVAEAQAAGIDARQQVVGADLGHLPRERPAIAAEVFEADAVEWPGDVSIGKQQGSVHEALVVAHARPPGSSGGSQPLSLLMR